MKTSLSTKLHLTCLFTLLTVFLFSACAPEPQRPRRTDSSRGTSAQRATGPVEALEMFRPREIGRLPEPGERPWMTHLVPVDLDGDGLLDILSPDAKEGTVNWFRQLPDGTFDEIILATDLPAPVRLHAVDMNGNGSLDIIASCMTMVFPNNDRIGSIVILENDGNLQFTPHTILENVARVTDVQTGDFNGNGRLDLAVAQFGYNEGEVRWMENLGNWEFRSHILLSLPGAVDVRVADLTGNRHLDIVTIISQQYQEIYLFEGNGRGNFSQKMLWGSTNEDYGSSGIELHDMNRNGRLDILYTNGDGFDYAEPGSRPWHGVQWIENLGRGFFAYHRIGNMPGAYSPIAADFTGNGEMDIIAVSGFNEWHLPRRASIMLFANDGEMNFTPMVLAYKPTHLISAAVFPRGEGKRPGFVTSGFHAYPPYDEVTRLVLWEPVED